MMQGQILRLGFCTKCSHVRHGSYLSGLGQSFSSTAIVDIACMIGVYKHNARHAVTAREHNSPMYGRLDFQYQYTGICWLEKLKIEAQLNSTDPAYNSCTDSNCWTVRALYPLRVGIGLSDKG